MPAHPVVNLDARFVNILFSFPRCVVIIIFRNVLDSIH